MTKEIKHMFQLRVTPEIKQYLSSKGAGQRSRFVRQLIWDAKNQESILLGRYESFDNLGRRLSEIKQKVVENKSVSHGDYDLLFNLVYQHFSVGNAPFTEDIALSFLGIVKSLRVALIQSGKEIHGEEDIAWDLAGKERLIDAIHQVETSLSKTHTGVLLASCRTSILRALILMFEQDAIRAIDVDSVLRSFLGSLLKSAEDRDKHIRKVNGQLPDTLRNGGIPIAYGRGYSLIKSGVCRVTRLEKALDKRVTIVLVNTFAGNASIENNIEDIVNRFLNREPELKGALDLIDWYQVNLNNKNEWDFQRIKLTFDKRHKAGKTSWLKVDEVWFKSVLLTQKSA
jgi:hypothetical protein